MTTIAEIRAKSAYIDFSKPTLKQSTRHFARQICDQYPIALTLTVKQHVTTKNNNGVFVSKLNSDSCRRVAERFTQKLNRTIFGKRAAEKHGKSLKYFVVVEGARSHKNLHLHIAIGDLPKHVSFNQVNALVCEAKGQIRELDVQHHLSIADSGWIDYITKEVGKHDTDNVLWDLT